MSTHIRPSQKSEQFASRDEIHDHIQIRRILERAPEVNNKRVLHGSEHLLFIVRVLNLLRFNDLVLIQDFHCVEAEIMFASHWRSLHEPQFDR